MGYRLVDISSDVYIWAQQVEVDQDGGSILYGMSFDGWYGFGSEKAREFSGVLCALSEQGRSTFTAQLSRMHVAHRGFPWWISAGDLPSPPFLLTSNVKLDGPFRRKIEFSPTPSTQEQFLHDGEGYYPVVSEGLIGILIHSDQGNELIGFHSRDKQIDTVGTLVFSEWDDEAGKFSLK